MSTIYYKNSKSLHIKLEANQKSFAASYHSQIFRSIIKPRKKNVLSSHKIFTSTMAWQLKSSLDSHVRKIHLSSFTALLLLKPTFLTSIKVYVMIARLAINGILVYSN